MSALSPKPRDPEDSTQFIDYASDPGFRAIVEQVQAEKKAALADPGPPWKEWLLYTAAKWYIGLGFLIVDGWIVAFWLYNDQFLPILPCLLAALYAEFLVWQFLWYRPEVFHRGSAHRRRRSGSHWIHPVSYGRWTPEADIARAAGGEFPSDLPDPNEFL